MKKQTNKAVEAKSTTNIEAPEAVKVVEVVETEKPQPAETAITENTAKAPKANVLPKVYSKKAYVVAYRSPKARIEALKQRKPDAIIPEEEAKQGEAQITLEGHFEWVKLPFGGVFPGTMLNVTYQKDATGRIVRHTLIAHKG